MCRGREDGLIVLLFLASVDFAVLSVVQMWNKKMVRAMGKLEFATKQLLRESSIVSNSCISSLLRLFGFFPGKCYGQAWTLFVEGDSDGDHVGGSFLYWLAIEQYQTGGKKSPIC